MKVLQFLLRTGIGILIGMIASYSVASIFFNYSGYPSNIDRAFLVGVPALAIAFLVFEAFPFFGTWIQQRQSKILILLVLPALIGAAVLVLSHTVSSFYYLGLLVLALVLYLLMLPAVKSVERVSGHHSSACYFFGSFLSLGFVYGMVGFLSTVLTTIFNMLVFSFIAMLGGSVIGYYLVRRAARSFRDGFLHQPLNIILSLMLPVFLAGIIYVCVQFPVMFVWDTITVPGAWLGPFIASALLAGVWGMSALEQFEARGLYERFEATKLFTFITENLPGLYAGGMFFLINLVIALSLNHPALSINSVLFETDAGPWMSILGSPQGDAINRSVHPLVLLLVRPLVRFVSLFLADQWQLAPILLAATLSGACVLMAWIFVKRATNESTYAFLFAILLGATATHLFFGSLTETYVFGMTSLIFFFLLIQARETRFSVLIPAGLIVFGITISNIAQAAIGLFFNKFGFWKLVRYCATILAGGIILTVLTSMIHPYKQTFFFVPADIAFESRFVKPVYESPAGNLLQRGQLVARTMFLYSVVGPKPIEDISHKDPAPTIDLKTYNPSNNLYASYKGFANIPLALWLIILVGSAVFFFKGLRRNPHLPLMLGLLGSLAFNFLLHMNYGTELFLYTPYWIYALIFFLALAFAELAGRKWFESVLTIFLLTLMANNIWFIFVILHGLAPFYAAS